MSVSSIQALENLGRRRLSKHFFMREFLYSEVGNYFGIPNLPTDPKLAIAAGQCLCQKLLDPLFETFGNVTVRSGYRSEAVNAVCNQKKLGCAQNEKNYAGHIWDRRDKDGNMGACVSISIPWFAEQYEHGRDWRDMAWWMHDHLPYSQMYFFPKRAAFNLTWRAAPERKIMSYVTPKGTLLAAGAKPDESIDMRRARYQDFPVLVAP